MATYYVDLENGSNTQAGTAPLKKLNCTITYNSTTVAVADASGISVGMRVLSTDMNNSGGHFASGTTVSSVSGLNVTISSAALSSGSGITVIFSGAKKSISAAVSLATQPGDSVRIKTSKPAVNTGLTGTWSNGAFTIPFTGGSPIAEIDNCESGWVAVSPFTIANDTTYFYQGTRSQRITSATTSGGVMAYKTLSSPLNLAGYSRISLVANNTMPTANGVVKINLCSDANGQVPVYSGVIPPQGSSLAYNATNTSAFQVFYPVVIDVGANMSTLINSISIERQSAVGSTSYTVSIDNIVACKGESESMAISHKSLIGKNTSGEAWWSIRSLSSGGVTLLSTRYGYYGSSATAPIYRKEPVQLNNTDAFFTASTSGLQSARITISGGWNEVDMTTQTGDTLIQGDWASNGGSAFVTVSGSYVTVEKLTYNRMYTDSDRAITVSGREAIVGIGFINNRIYTTSVGYVYVLSGNNLNQTVKDCVINGNERGDGAADGLSVFYHSSYSIYSLSNAVVTNGYGPVFNNSYDQMDVHGCTFWYYKFFQDTTTLKRGIFDLCSIKAMDGSSGLSATFTPSGMLLFKNCITDIVDNSTNRICNFVGATHSASAETRFHNFNQVTDDHRIFSVRGEIFSDYGVNRHTASGIAWGLKPKETVVGSSENPLAFSLAKVYVSSGKTVSAVIWVKRNSADLNCGIRVKSGDLVGLVETRALCTASNGTWEQITLSFVAPQSGVVDVEAFAFGSANSTAWFDDFSVTEA